MATKITYTLVNRLKRELNETSPEKDYEIRDAELKGFSLRIRKSAKAKAGYTMTYQVVYARGKRVTLGSADHIDPDQARAAAKKIASDHCHAEVGIGEDPIEKRKRVVADNYLQFIEDSYKPYLAANLRKGVNNSKNVNETLACLKNGFPEFHRLGLNEITPLNIEKWRQRRRQEGISSARINRQMNDLRACLNRAVKWGALSANPFDKVERTKLDTNAKVRYLTSREEAKLRSKLDEREANMKAARQRANEWRAERGYDLYTDIGDNEFADHLKPAVLLSLDTGLRRGELLNMKWSDVDFEQKHLTVVGEGAKSGQTRHVPLNSEALEVLKQWKQQQSANSVQSIWVFHGKDGQPFENLRKSWIGVLEDAKITDFRWHDLRHTFASKLVMAGVDLNTVRELLGHSDYKMTLRYAHLAPKHKQDAVDKLVVASA